MECPKCYTEQSDEDVECARCGVIFEKFMTHQRAHSRKRVESEPLEPQATEDEAMQTDVIGIIKNLFLYVKPRINPLNFAGRVIVFLIIIFWGCKYISSSIESNYTGQSFLHLVNLPFHEAGHMIFRPFGQFMMMLGGSLTQLLIPFTCVLAFLLKSRDTFGATVALWWLGQSFMDLAPYINDARARKLILLGGVTGRDVDNYHDWEFLLRKMGWLQYDHLLAQIANISGIILMLTTFVWGGYILYKQLTRILHE